MKIATLAGILMLSLACSNSAFAITAALAKKCEAAALLAFPNQKIGTTIGVAERSKFRDDCIAKNGDIPPPVPQSPK
jgi:hypothetical protein